VSGHKNVHFLREQPEQGETQPPAECKKVIEAEVSSKRYRWAQESRIELYASAPKAARQQEQAELLSFLDKNNNVFTWSTFNLVGVSRDVIEHQLQVSPNARHKKTKAS
jgi:hypothetical protein